MEIGRKGFTERELQEHYPKVYQRLFHPKKKVSKTRVVKAVRKPFLTVAPKKAAPRVALKIPKKRKNAPKNLAEKALKKDDRLVKNNSKLLEQLTFINQRIETMERDKEHYALVDATVNSDNTFTFSIVRINDQDSPLTLILNDKSEMTCSCMDWRIRCRSLSVPCKHIYYLLVKILTYELYDYYDNQVMDPVGFRQLVNRRVMHNGLNFDAAPDRSVEEDICAICYTHLNDKVVNDGLLKCPDCHKHLHKGCVNAWMNHSPKRNCVYCKSEKWNMYFANLQKN